MYSEIFKRLLKFKYSKIRVLFLTLRAKNQNIIFASKTVSASIYFNLKKNQKEFYKSRSPILELNGIGRSKFLLMSS